jgi:heme-degrading monooxygenase HmoA
MLPFHEIDAERTGPLRSFAPIMGAEHRHPAQRGGGGDVFARVSELEARPEQLDEMNREGVEHILPALRMQAGFNGGLVLADRKSGKVLAVTFWETEQAMDATEEAAHWLLTFGTETAGGKIKGVGRYEVFFVEVLAERA